MSRPVIAVIALFSAIMAGCTTSLEGDWDGEVDCGSLGSVPMSMEITSAGGRDYDGSGTVTGWYVDNSEAGIAIDIELQKDKSYGAQTLDVDNPKCVLYVSGESPSKMDCEAFTELGWDGGDTLGAEIENFLGLGEDCDLELQR